MDFLIFDLETNGLLADVNKIHSLVIKNVTTKEVISCADQDGYTPIDKGIVFESTIVISECLSEESQ